MAELLFFITDKKNGALAPFFTYLDEPGVFI